MFQGISKFRHSCALEAPICGSHCLVFPEGTHLGGLVSWSSGCHLHTFACSQLSNIYMHAYIKP